MSCSVFLPLTSASMCKVTNNECWEKSQELYRAAKDRILLSLKYRITLNLIHIKCKASNIIGTVEIKIELPNEKEDEEPPSSTTNDEIKTIIHEHIQKKTCGKHYFARVVLIGKNGVGKTSLMRRLLLGTKEQSSFTESTDSIDIKKCNINVKDGNWSPCNKLKESLTRVGADIKHKIMESLKSTWNSINEFAKAHKSSQLSLEEQVDSQMSSVMHDLR
ncbi:unnamed protein product [Mytilus edulis]|uniref:Uncharacterized protein n=1 Tax=Mytilus edulis TaxID=6550 RepID=A0A8S3QBA3_MYTED|nr:unnamed protein product [Mytilus edulis]